MLKMKDLWGLFSKDMRPFWLAQRERCPYCGYKIPLVPIPSEEKLTRSTWDHVFPRSRWGSHSRSYVLAHSACNTIKGARHPYPCEILFRDFTNEIVDDIVFAGKPVTSPQGEKVREPLPDRQ